MDVLNEFDETRRGHVTTYVCSLDYLGFYEEKVIHLTIYETFFEKWRETILLFFENINLCKSYEIDNIMLLIAS